MSKPIFIPTCVTLSTMAARDHVTIINTAFGRPFTAAGFSPRGLVGGTLASYRITFIEPTITVTCIIVCYNFCSLHSKLSPPQITALCGEM